MRSFKGLTRTIASSVTLVFVSTSVFAAEGGSGASSGEGVGGVALRVQTQVGQIADLIGAVAFLLGLLLIVMGLMKFKQHSDNPNDPSAKTSTAIVLVLVGAAMIALPTVAGVGIASLFQDGATTVTTGGQLRSLN